MSGVEIRVRANTISAEKDIARLGQSIKGLEGTVSRASNNLKRLATGLTAAIGGGLALRGITRATDSVTEFSNRIALVTGRGAEAKRVMDQLYAASARSRTKMSGAVDVFNRFGLALKDSGVGADQLIALTETIQQAVTISGASAASAEAALVQLGQGIASGQLRGQELNSVLEQTPRLARAIADGMGIPFGQLRDYAMEGKLTAEEVIGAIESQATKLQQEFAVIDKTVGSVAVVFRDQLGRAIADLDNRVGFSRAIVAGIEAITNALQSFTANLDRNLWIAKAAFVNFKAFLILSAHDLIEALPAPFREAFDKIAEIINSAREGIRDFFTTEIIPEDIGARNERMAESLEDLGGRRRKTIREILDLGDTETVWSRTVDVIIAGANRIQTALSPIGDFAAKVIQFFADIWNALWANSTWKDTVEAVEKGGDRINAVADTIGQFKDFVVSSFDAIWNSAKRAFEYIKGFVLDQDISELLQGNIMLQADSDQLFSTRGTSRNRTVPTPIKDIAKTYAESIWSAIKSAFEEITSKENLLDGVFDKLTDTGKPLIDVTFGTIEEKVDTGATIAGGFLSSLRENAQDIGTAIGLAAAFVLSAGASNPMNTMGGRAKLLAGGAAAAAFGPELLNSEAFQSGARGVGNSIISLIMGDPEAAGSDWGSRFMKGLIDSISAFGQGINPFNSLEERQGNAGDPDLVDTFAGIIAASLLGAVVSGKVITVIGTSVKFLSGQLLKAFSGVITKSFGSKVLASAGKAAGTRLMASFAVGVTGATGLVVAAVAAALGLAFYKATGFLRPEQIAEDTAQRQMQALASGLNMTGIEGPLQNELLNLSQTLNKAFPDGIIDWESVLAGDNRATNKAMYGVDTRIMSILNPLRNSPQLEQEARKLLETLNSTFVDFDFDTEEALDNLLTQFKDVANGGGVDLRKLLEDARIELSPEDLIDTSGGASAEADKLGAAMEAAAAGTLTWDDALATASIDESIQAIRDNVVALNGVDFISDEQISKLDQAGSAFDRIMAKLDVYAAKVKEVGAAVSSVSLTPPGAIAPTTGGHVPGRASGGLIIGPGSATSDSILARLSNGEYVIQASAVEKFGTGFLDAINSGNLPRFDGGGYNGTGGLAGTLTNITNLNLQRAIEQGNVPVQRDLENLLYESQIQSQQRAEAEATAQALSESIEGNTAATAANTAGGGDSAYEQLSDDDKYYRDTGINAATNIRDGFKSAFSQFFRDGDFKGLIMNLLDNITGTIIDTFVNSFFDKMFEPLIGDQNAPGPLSMLFEQGASFAGGLGTTLGDGMVSGLQGLDLSGLFGGMGAGGGALGGFFQQLFGGLGGLFGGSFAFTPALGFSEGGLVPKVKGSKANIDSVPAMLTPGELVVPKKNIDSLMEGARASNNTTVNLKIVGDVSRQTKAEIMRMLPEIAMGVNAQNKENGLVARR